MNKKIWVGVLVGLLTVGGVAQSAKDGERVLRDAVVTKQRFLRGFNADTKVHWQWDGQSLVQKPTQTHTLAVLVAKTIKVKGNKVEIQGERHTLLRASDTAFTLSAAMQQVSVEIDLTAADMAKVLPKLADLVFYEDKQHALADLPPIYQSSLPANMDSKCCSKRPERSPKSCDCADTGGPTCLQKEPAVGMAGMKPPKLLSSVEPQFSEEARQHKISGAVEVGLTVDSAGNPSDLWIAKPAGFGLDGEALNAVSQYKFAPATCHGQAVPVALSIGVDFRIF